MSMLTTIKNELLVARKTRNTIKSNLLNTLLSEATRVGKDNGNRETTDSEVILIAKKFLKSVEENIEKARTDEALRIASEEQEILLEYLPKQLSRNELKEKIVGLNTKDRGVIMKTLKERYAGQYNSKIAAAIIDEV